MNKELRSKSNEELIDLIVRLKGQMLQYRFKLAHGELEKPHVLQETRRTIARIYTILTERKVDINLTNKLNSTLLQPQAQSAAVTARSNLRETRSQKKAKRLKKLTSVEQEFRNE